MNVVTKYLNKLTVIKAEKSIAESRLKIITRAVKQSETLYGRNVGLWFFECLLLGWDMKRGISILKLKPFWLG